MTPTNMELNQLLQYVKEMKAQRGFDGTNLEQEMVLLTEEVGELASEVWKIVKTGQAGPDNRRDMAFEIVDCLIFLLSMADIAGIEDLEAYFQQKEAINTTRFREVE